MSGKRVAREGVRQPKFLITVLVPACRVPAACLPARFEADVADRMPADALRIGTPLDETMTSARQQRTSARPAARGWSGVTGALACGLGLAGVVILGMPFMAGAATTQRVVHDTYTGLAINGVDPVAYFTDAAPLEAGWGFAADFVDPDGNPFKIHETRKSSETADWAKASKKA